MLSSTPRPSTADADGYRAYVARRRRRVAATNAALSNPDIVACILRGNVGPSTFAVASEVCRAWLAVCRSDATVLRDVAMFQGGLTKAKLKHLFAISDRAADALPRTLHARHGGDTYQLYRAPAVDKLLGADGMAAWRLRLRERAASQWSPFLLWPPPACPPRRAHWQEEARLHAIAKVR
jgi:hypothetical protein